MATKKNNIVSVENCFSDEEIIVSSGSLYCQRLYENFAYKNCMQQIVTLGNGKKYVIKKTEDFIDYDNDFLITEKNKPIDYDKYQHSTWIEYMIEKGWFGIEMEANGFIETEPKIYYNKKQKILSLYLQCDLHFTDAEIIKVLTDDYKHRLSTALKKVSDETGYYHYKQLVEDYEEDLNADNFYYNADENILKNVNSKKRLVYLLVELFLNNKSKTISLSDFTKDANDALNMNIDITKLDKLLKEYTIDNYNNDLLLQREKINNEVFYKVIRYGKSFIRKKYVFD